MRMSALQCIDSCCPLQQQFQHLSDTPQHHRRGNATECLPYISRTKSKAIDRVLHMPCMEVSVPTSWNVVLSGGSLASACKLNPPYRFMPQIAESRRPLTSCILNALGTAQHAGATLWWAGQVMKRNSKNDSRPVCTDVLRGRQRVADSLLRLQISCSPNDCTCSVLAMYRNSG